jgi:porphobilinogen synthase
MHNSTQTDEDEFYSYRKRLSISSGSSNACSKTVFSGVFMLRRARRNRKSAAIRAMVQESSLTPQDLVQGYFLLEGTQKRVPIASMPGINRLSIDLLLEEAQQIYERGVPAICLFPVADEAHKNEQGSALLREDGFVVQALQALKKAMPHLCVTVDLALDPYTSHGHDGLVNAKGEILNDETVEVLTKAAVLLGHAGADMIAPSDMMDGRVGAIRRSLDAAQLHHVSIVAHSAKYASAFYGPYRDALSSAPRFGDKKTYQLDPANSREALLETDLDEEEGADFLMIKPALAYLDIIAKVRAQTTLPIAAFNVSGEYAMVIAASQQGWLDRDRAFYEMLLSMKRAGADVIFTYAASLALDYLVRSKSRVSDF